MEHFYEPDEVIYEEVVTTEPGDIEWMDDRQGTSGFELTDTKCFKTPSGVQKTATISRQQLSKTDEKEDYCMEGTSTMPMGTDPLRTIRLRIAKKVLKFKVIDASDAPESTDNFDQTWLNQLEPVKEPKSLAGLYNCTNCKTYFGNVDVFKNHMMNVHSDGRTFRCFSCGMNFASKASMTNHLKEHSLITPLYECEICQKVFAKPDNYTSHMKLHRYYFNCKICLNFFRTQDLLLKHTQTTHCPQPKHIPNVELLKNGKTARHKCSYCDQKFHFRRDLITHERTHTGEKPYECGYCTKAFAQSQALTVHIRTHTNEMPYSCTTCQKKFRDNSSLRKHELHSHTRTDPNQVIYKITRNDRKEEEEEIITGTKTRTHVEPFVGQ